LFKAEGRHYLAKNVSGLMLVSPSAPVGEGNKGPFFGAFVWQADLPYNPTKMGAYV
jgi:hypothetical protein